MLIQDIMTKNVVTVPSNTPASDAIKILKEHDFRRLPVVDDGKLVGVVTQARLEGVSAKRSAPLLWQIGYLISHTTVKDVMRKRVVTISPEATVEQGVALAQKCKVGILVVVKGGKLIGVVTTNDFFYRVVNPILGIGEPGTRIMVAGGGQGKAAEKIIACINKLKIRIKIIWTLKSPVADGQDIIIQLDTEDATAAIEALTKLGFEVSIRPR